jgi:hypothetical protein
LTVAAAARSMALTSRPVGAACVRGTCRASRQAAQGRAISARSRGRASPACAAVPDTTSSPAAAAAASTGGGGSKAGRMTYKPSSYAVIVSDAVKALQAAMAEGHTLCEIEFPPVPSTTDCE